MDSKENILSGVTVIRAEAPSNYHVAQRSDPPSPPSQPASTPPSGVVALTSPVFVGSIDRKKRGRPRKYGPDGSGQRLPMPVSTGKSSSGKRGRGKSAPSETKHQQKIQTTTTGDEFVSSDGANFTPHVITVNVGEDVTAKIISFCQQGPRAICILSANGMISNASLRQSDSSGGTLTYEGRFEIVNLCGSFTPTEREGTIYRAGGLSVSMSSPNGQVVGGCVAGLLIAATPVQIIVGSFLPSTPPEVKPTKPKAQQPSSSHSPFTITAALPSPSNVDKEPCNGQGHNSSSNSMIQNLPSQATIKREKWPHPHSIQERRMSITDINISLPEGMQ